MLDDILKCGHHAAVEQIVNISGGAYVKYTCIRGCETEWEYIGCIPNPGSIDMIDELAILGRWVLLNNTAGMWSGYPLGGAYIDTRCGTGYGMPDVKHFVDCDRTVRYQLPHMCGKYRADVEVRIDELKEAVMTDSEKHHTKLDELIDDARKEMHRMMNSAMLSGAVSDEMLRPDTYFLARSIITIYGDERPHAPPSIIMNREIDNLAKVI